MAAKKKTKWKASQVKAKTPETCLCISQINALLAPRNGRLIGTIMLYGGTPRVYVAVEKLDTANRMKPPLLGANFCPFCGKAT